MSTTARLGIASAVLFLLSTLARAGNGLVRDGRVLTEYRPPVIESPDAALLVVTLLDGRVVAVRMDSGEVMWTYDTGTPLVTAKQAKAMVPDLRIFPGVDGRLYLYGSALATADGSTSGTKLERLPISLPELVAASPSVTHDGSLITGARSTEVLLLDRLTGKRLGGGAAAAGAGVGSGVGGAGAGPGGVGAAAAAEAGEAAGAAPGPGLGADAGVGVGSPATIGLEDRALLPLPDPDRVVVLGREDFVVRSIKSGAELWNVSFSRLVNMQPQGAAAAAAAAAAAGAAEQAAAETLDALPYFTVRADHTLQAYDPTSRIRRWALSFDAAPVGVFATRLGDTNFLDPEVRAAQRLHLHLHHQQQSQQQPSPHAGGRQPQQQQVPGDGKGGKQGAGQCPDWSVGGLAALVRRQGNSGGNAGAGGGAEGGTCSPAGSGGSGSGSGGRGSSSQVLVGRLRGSLYALPADHVTLEEGGAQANSLALSGPTSTAPLALPQLPPSTSPASAAASAATTADKALAVIDSSSGGGSSRTDVMTYMADVETGEGVVSGLVCPPGVHLLATLDEPKEPRGPWPWLPNAVQTSPAPKALGEGSSAQWPRLPAAAGAGAGGGRGAGADGAWWATVVVAGLAGAVVVIVVVSLRGRGKAAAAAVEMAAAKAPGATGAAAGGAGGGGQQLDVDVDAVTGGSSGSTSSVGKGRAAGGGGQQRRRKGRNTTGSAASGGGGGNGSAAAAAAGAASSPPSRGEEEQRRGSSSGEPLPRLSAAPAPTSDAAAQLLPSAEPRVQVRPDGSVAIGRLLVGPGILGYGSAGTVVYEGKLDGRPVAVKRLLRQFTALARKEIEVLILSDEHPNVVRCFAMEEDREFVYLALERCRSTLADFLTSPDGREQFVEAASGQPTQRCLSAMLDVCRGLAALHERGIVHRDLKPQNVLLTESSQRAKLSDMGLSKLLVPEQSSFVLYDNSHMGGYGSGGAGGGGAGSSSSGGPSCGPGGSSGWQAPEQLIARGGGEARQTRSMDVFSLGCVLYYCMTGGRHPFGDSHYERDANILHGAPRLGPLAAAAGPEAAHLVGACLGKEAGRRPVLPEVLGHPLWWSDERRLAFLVDISDRIEFEDREPDTSLLEALEGFAGVALAGQGLLQGEAEAPGAPCPSTSTSFGAPSTATSAPPSSLPSSSSPPNWGAALPAELVANLGRYRRYEYTSLRDLLRVVRNKRNHFREMPQQLQALMGPLPGGFLRFFTARFPRLLLSVYVFALRHLAVAGGGGEQQLAQYWPHAGGGQQQTGNSSSSSGSGGQAFVQVYMAQYGPCLRAPKAPQQQQQPPTASQAVPEAAAGEEEAPSGLGRAASSAAAASSSSAGAAAAVVAAGMSNGAAGMYHQTATPLLPPSAASLPPASALQTLTPPFPNAGLLPHTLPHPPAPPPPPAQPATPAPLVLVGYEPCGEEGECHIREFPRRPGKQHCDFYVKTGHCKFGETCVFDHPLEFAVRLSSLGLPLRPSEPLCSFYLKNNDCRFGPACKFHHPMLRPVFAGSAAAAAGAAGVVGIAGSEAGAVAQN